MWLTVANVLASGTVSVLPVVSGMVEEALMRWLRAAELTCDRAALLVAQVISSQGMMALPKGRHRHACCGTRPRVVAEDVCMVLHTLSALAITTVS